MDRETIVKALLACSAGKGRTCSECPIFAKKWGHNCHKVLLQKAAKEMLYMEEIINTYEGVV